MRNRMVLLGTLAGLLLLISGVIALLVVSPGPSEIKPKGDLVIEVFEGMVSSSIGATDCKWTGMMLEDHTDRVLVTVEWKTPSGEVCGLAVSWIYDSGAKAGAMWQTLSTELLTWENAEVGKGEDGLVVWARPICVEASIEACAETVVGRVGRVVFQATTYSPNDPSFVRWWKVYMEYLKEIAGE